MPHRYADPHPSGSDREISLGTGTILASFFALALVCSIFFGFGYTIGHKSSVPSAVAGSNVPPHSLSDAFKSFKPAPGGPNVEPAATAKAANPDEPVASTSPTSIVVPTTARPVINAATQKPFDPDAEIVTTAPSTKAPATRPNATVRSTPADIPQTSPAAGAIVTGNAFVQVAAVSHQEDADTLIAALNRKGYTVAVHHEPQDKLLHIQLGPYPSRKDAEAMRQRLQSDGYNAILK